MATVNHKKAITAAEVTAFGGIDASSPHGDGGLARDIKNFKVLSDGSLALRDGFAVLATLGDAVRGVHVCRDGGGTFLLAVAGAALYRISVSDGSQQHANVLDTHEGAVCFFEYDGQIYLLDGNEAYRYDGGVTLSVCHGYVPLYGLDWNPDSAANPIHEPINLLSDKIRITYRKESAFSQIRIGICVTSVDQVIVNGTALHPNSYSLSEDGTYIRLTTLFQTASPVTVCATVDHSFWHDTTLRTCTEVATYESFSGSRVFLYGGEDASRLFVSRPKDEASLAASRMRYPDAGALYIPKGTELAIGSYQPVTAVTRVGDRMMICTRDEAWMTGDLSTEEAASGLVLRALSRTLGCRALGAIAVVDGNAPVTVSAGGIYRWTVETEPTYSCSVTCLSAPVSPLFGVGFLERARVCYVHGEDTLWFLDPDNAEGRVFLYDCAAGLWYSYTDVAASCVFDVGEAVGFFGDTDVCLFHRGRTTDLGSFGEREIEGVFESRRMDFGDSESVKRAVRVYAEADIGGGNFSIRLADGRLLDEKVFVGEEEGSECYETRVLPRRFRRLSVTLRATGGSAQRIFGFCVHVAR